LLGRGVGQRSQQDAIDDAEHHRRNPDAECERQGGDGGEGRRQADRAQGITNILKKCGHGLGSCSATVEALVYGEGLCADEGHVAELAQCATAGLVRRCAGGLVLLATHVEMEAELLIQLLLDIGRPSNHRAWIPVAHRDSATEGASSAEKTAWA
jgi:hypothetical protein